MKQQSILFTLSAILLSSCSFGSFSSSSTQKTTPPTPTTITSEKTTEVATSTPEATTTQVASQEEATSISKEDDTSSSSAKLEKTKMRCDYSDFTKHNLYALSSCPTEGEVHPLLIPVWFTDSNDYIPSSKKNALHDDIQKAYFGTQEETGWHSVKTFYYEESGGRLTLDGVTSPWYEVGKSSQYYYQDDNEGNKMYNFVNGAIDWYFGLADAKPRSYFDADHDGYLDAVLFIYAAPEYDSLGNDDADNLWAYCYWQQDEELKKVNNPGPNVYFWASYDFMYGTSTAQSLFNNSYAYGDTRHCNIDAHTYIHEMGHVFGLDDYYDYGNGSRKPAGGFSMQDMNIGGHDPYSALGLGWVDPYIPKQSCTIEISSFTKNHDCILLTPNWNEFDSPFDEYLLLELFTPTGLNEFDCTYNYMNAGQGPNATGLRVWHIDSRLVYCDKLDSHSEPIVSINQLTTDPNYDCAYGVACAFNNTSSGQYLSLLGSNYKDYNLLQLIRNSTTETYKSQSQFSADDLFVSGDEFTMAKYSKQFLKEKKLNSNKSLGWSFSVEIAGEGEDAVASVTLVKEA